MTTMLTEDRSAIPVPAVDPHGRQVRKAAPHEARPIARTLARAFYDDPVIGWLLPNPSRRLARMERCFGLLFDRVFIRHEESYTTDGLEGAALWLPPDEWKLPPARQARFVPGLIRAVGAPFHRFLRASAFAEARHPKAPHFYLEVLGVDPSLQGRGIGSRLMGPVLERCDQARLPSYLEASNEGSRDLYLRHGFEVMEEVRLPAGGPPLWLMWREPRG